MIVIDASVAASWILPGEDGPRLDAVLVKYDRLLAPHLFWSEIRNVLLVAERRGRIEKAIADVAIEEITKLHFEFDHEPSSEEVMRLARLYSLSIYDAVYLELAQRHKADLATLDQKLILAAKAENIIIYS